MHINDDSVGSNDSPVTLSVIIPCLNGQETLGVQLEALSKQTWDNEWEVIVADNGSTDATFEIIETYKKRIKRLRVVDASDRKGPAHARNVGARAARGKLLAFCDADDEVAPGWIAAIGESIHANTFVASMLDFEKLSDPLFLKEKKRRRQQNGLIQYNYVTYMPHADTSGLGVTRELHEDLEGFDEEMLCCEDCDYCWRGQLKGVPLVFESKALVFKRNKSGANSFSQAKNWGEYNVFLNKKFQPLGMPKVSWKSGVHLWWNLLKKAPFMLTDKGKRQIWLWNFGYRLGHLRGSLKYKIIAL